MGMFDYVKYSAACSKCGSKIDEWQSKDGPCTLDTVDPSQVRFFSGTCLDCGNEDEVEVVVTAYRLKLVSKDNEE